MRSWRNESGGRVSAGDEHFRGLRNRVCESLVLDETTWEEYKHRRERGSGLSQEEAQCLELERGQQEQGRRGPGFAVEGRGEG